MRGTDVRVLQDFLTKVGVRTTVDGQYGPGTATRVRRWERKSSLPVNGRITRADAATLRGQVAQDALTQRQREACERGRIDHVAAALAEQTRLPVQIAE